MSVKCFECGKVIKYENKNITKKQDTFGICKSCFWKLKNNKVLEGKK